MVFQMIMMMTVITGQFLVQCNNFCANNLSQAVPFSGNAEPRVYYFSFDPLKDRSPQKATAIKN